MPITSRTFMTCLILLLLCTPVIAQHKQLEKPYQEKWCNEHQGQYETSQNRCLTTTHTVKFSIAEQWREALGQTLHDSIRTQKKPGIVLILKKPNDNTFLSKLKTTIKYHKLDIDTWTIKNYQSSTFSTFQPVSSLKLPIYSTFKPIPASTPTPKPHSVKKTDPKSRSRTSSPRKRSSTRPTTRTRRKYSCSPRKTCSQMTSCAEAKFHLYTCGNKKLDRDRDGIPCETICK